VSTQVWSKIGGGGESKGGGAPCGDLAPCVTKPMVGSPSGGLISHGGNPARAKQWITKAHVSWAQDRKPEGHKSRGPGPRQQACWGKDWVLKHKELTTRPEVGVGGITWWVPQFPELAYPRGVSL
jgi:hypothetical protein